MNTTPARPVRRNALLETLMKDYPVFRDYQPLVLGIHKHLRERQPELAADAVRAALRAHTASTKYLKALAQASQRFDLDGQVAGEVTQEQRDHATTTLKDRFKQAAERKKAAEAEEKLQANMAKLAEKFNVR